MYKSQFEEEEKNVQKRLLLWSKATYFLCCTVKHSEHILLGSISIKRCPENECRAQIPMAFIGMSTYYIKI